MIRFGKQSGTAIQQYSKRTPTKRTTSTLFVSFQYETNLHRTHVENQKVFFLLNFIFIFQEDFLWSLDY